MNNNFKIINANPKKINSTNIVKRNQYKELETDRLILRKLMIEDTQILWDKFFNDYNNYKFYKFEKINSFEEYRENVKNQVGRYNVGNYFRWSIVETETGLLIGNINLHHYDTINNSIKIGYFILENYRNHGYALDSLKRIVEYAFYDLNVHRIAADTVSINATSNKVLTNAGFKLEGLIKENKLIDGIYYDSNLYGIINSK